EAAGEDERLVALDELVEARPDSRLAREVLVDLVQGRSLHGRELRLHQLAIADLAAKELLARALEDLVVAELLEHEPEQGHHRAPAVPVEDEPRPVRVVRHRPTLAADSRKAALCLVTWRHAGR